MSRALRTMLAVAAVGTVTSAIFCGLAVTAAVRFRRRRRRELAVPAEFVPPVSGLKPLHGVEDGLEENLHRFFRQRYAGPWELLFCARNEEDAGLRMARAIAERYPEVEARFLVCGEPQFPNPKMYSLAMMAEAARYECLITSDADARVEPEYLRKCVQALADPAVALAFPVYVGEAVSGSLHTRLDAVGKSVEMGSGVLVAEMLAGGADFALGVTMILRKKAFAQAGGVEELGHYWAEDFVLGNRLHAKGLGVKISPHVIRLTVPDAGIRRSFRDQLRWMQSTRRSRPWGHLGTGLTFALPFGLLGCAAEAARGRWSRAGWFLAVAIANRLLQAAVVLQALGADEVWEQAVLFPLRDLLGSLVWVCSYLPADTRYHGTQFRIMPDGRLLRA